MNLLQRFQRLLIAKVFTKDSNCIYAAESLLKKYLDHLTYHFIDTINLAYQIAMSNMKSFLCIIQILRDDVTGKFFYDINNLSNLIFDISVILLPELIVSLILLQQEIGMFLISCDWLQIFDGVLLALDKLCKLTSDIEASDADDIAWPGVMLSRSNNSIHKNIEDLPLIRKADIENHNQDGGLWVIINNKVYDIQDFRCENTNLIDLLQKYAGKDATHIFNNQAHSLSSLQIMENYVVGNYCQPEPELPHIPLDCLNVCSVLLDTERHLGYLLGLHAHYLRQSLPLQPAEISSKQFLNAGFLIGGLEVSYFRKI